MALKRKIAYIDLNTKKVETSFVPDTWRRKYLGGQGVATFLLSQHTPVRCGPLSPNNVIIISAGLLSGTVGTPSTCTYITTKSPLTGTLVSTSLSGSFAADLRWAGFDHVVINGRSRRIVYLFVHNGSIEIKNASELRGMGAYETQLNIRKNLSDEEIQVLSTGIAGENLVRFAHVVSGMKTISDKPGVGAVFGSKNLKAIACRGNQDIEIKCPEDAIACGRRIIKQSRLKKTNGKPGPDKSDATYQPLQVFANDYGIDLEMTINVINWAQALYRNGVVQEKQVKHFLNDSYNEDTIHQGITCIAHRKGFCNILAEGPIKAADAIGENSLDYYKNGKEKPSAAIDTKNNLKKRTKQDQTNMIAQIYKEMALGCLGISPCYNWLLEPKEPVHGDFIKLVHMNIGEGISLRKFKETAKRSFTLERLFNLREGITPEMEALAEQYFYQPFDNCKTEEIREVLIQNGDWDKQGKPTSRFLERLKITGWSQSKSVKGNLR